jgi:hypothetical protein
VQLWSRSDPHDHGVRLPASFFLPGPGNDCDFLVDVVEADDMDVFPTARIANEAKDIALACLLGEAVPTVGREMVGPRGLRLTRGEP